MLHQERRVDSPTYSDAIGSDANRRRGEKWWHDRRGTSDTTPAAAGDASLDDIRDIATAAAVIADPIATADAVAASGISNATINQSINLSINFSTHKPSCDSCTRTVIHTYL